MTFSPAAPFVFIYDDGINTSLSKNGRGYIFNNFKYKNLIYGENFVPSFLSTETFVNRDLRLININ